MPLPLTLRHSTSARADARPAQLDWRLRCPEFGSDRQRAEQVLSGVAEWITQEPVAELLEMFSRPTPAGWGRWPARSALAWLDQLEQWHQPCTLWDFRGVAGRAGHPSDDGRQGLGAARLHAQPAVLDAATEERVLALAGELGMRDASDAQKQEYDVVVALGGLRLSPKLRTAWALRQLTEQGVRAGSMVLLGTERRVQPSERVVTESYAPGAGSEFDLMLAAGINAGLIAPDSEPVPAESEGWSFQSYPGQAGAARVHAICARAPAPQRARPSTAQSIAFMLSRPEFARAQRILLVSNASCVPYQQVEMLRTVALPLRKCVEVIAVPIEHTAHLPGAQEPHNYLQELRSMFQASLRLHADYGGRH